MMRGWWLTRGVIVTATAFVSACAAHQQANRELQEKMAQLSARASRAVTEGVEQQNLSPEAEAAERAARTSREALKPGEPIWILSGKTRILHLAKPIRRVSVARPDLAGVVVLGPTTVMLNAK